MKQIGWAIALAAALATPAAAQTATTTNQPAVQGGQQATQPVSETGANALPPPTSEPFVYAAPTPGIGEPVPGGMGAQVQVSEIGQQAANFHDYWLLTLCAAITLIVLGLLAFAMVRFRRSAHATPSRTAHNTVIEVIWTVIPVLILVAIAIPSITLLARQYDTAPKDAVTVKVTGYQWYWGYTYPDNGGFEVISNMLPEEEAEARGEPSHLAADNRMVVPVGETLRIQVTGADVIHAFGIPSLWFKIDAVPGRLNERTLKVDEPGIYYGQCMELCGARHGYMPIVIEALPRPQFEAWVRSKGGTVRGDEPAAVPAAAPLQEPESSVEGAPGAGAPPTVEAAPGTAAPAA